MASVVCCVLAVMGALVTRVAAQEQENDSDFDGITAAELLEDGLDALSDHADESGRRLLERLVSEYPGTAAAQRAKRALAALDRGELAPEDRERLKADETERTTEYRRAFLVDVGDRVFFAENSAAIGGRARGIIEQQARWLAARPELSIMVIGRADGEGDGKSARDLSLLRAQAVRDRLVAAGLEQNRIEIKAAGDQDRIAVCSDPICSAQNRNVEVLINYWHSYGSWRPNQQGQGLAKSASEGPNRPLRETADQFSQ
ncbi:MAG: OmpA family protein [Hyphomicrobium sp.]|uniref:OmpA family protein n=1 Tax=Hyphomicrobium sp. TaxID=82 RepID=UPI0039E36BEC